MGWSYLSVRAAAQDRFKKRMTVSVYGRGFVPGVDAEVAPRTLEGGPDELPFYERFAACTPGDVFVHNLAKVHWKGAFAVIHEGNCGWISVMEAAVFATSLAGSLSSMSL